MPSPKSIGQDRQYNVTIHGVGVTSVMALNSEKARAIVVKQIMKANPGVSFHQARKRLTSCRLAPGTFLKLGRPRKDAAPKRAILPDDHTLPQW